VAYWKPKRVYVSGVCTTERQDVIEIFNSFFYLYQNWTNILEIRMFVSTVVRLFLTCAIPVLSIPIRINKAVSRLAVLLLRILVRLLVSFLRIKICVDFWVFTCHSFSFEYVIYFVGWNSVVETNNIYFRRIRFRVDRLLNSLYPSVCLSACRRGCNSGNTWTELDET